MGRISKLFRILDQTPGCNAFLIEALAEKGYVIEPAPILGKRMVKFIAKRLSYQYLNEESWEVVGPEYMQLAEQIVANLTKAGYAIVRRPEPPAELD